MNITIHAPVKVLLKKVFKISVYYSLFLDLVFISAFSGEALNATLSFFADFTLIFPGKAFADLFPGLSSLLFTV
jgi:hypothetical protein